MNSAAPPAQRSSLIAPVVTALLGAAVVVVPAGAASAAVSIGWSQRAGGLEAPTQVTSPRDGTGRLFVTEKSGLVRIFRGGRVLDCPFLDLRSRVRTDGEAGLLSIALHPRWKTKPYLWVAYVNRKGDLRVARFRAPSYRAARVGTRTYKRVIDVPHRRRFTNHFAGQLAFGRTGKLFLSTGDGVGRVTPPNVRRTRRH